MRGQRIPFIDGLRGLAIAMVLLFHAWMRDPPHPFLPTWRHNTPHLTGHPSLLDLLIARGYHGVTLFFVLSGFCLSYPALQRRRQGERDWFRPSVFFMRRFLRILPPYYAALGLSCLLFAALRAEHWPLTRDMAGAHLDPLTLVSHVLLLHNLLGTAYVLNGPFWSLGLEWQWYWVFPVVLLCAVRTPLLTALSCLIVAAAWAATMNGSQLLVSWLPGELFAFCCGILAAIALIRGHALPARYLGLGVIAAVLCAEAPLGTVIGDLGLYVPLYAIAFALLIVLAAHSAPVRGVFSFRPLVFLGAISYSVYLVHRPLIDLVELNAPPAFRSSPFLIPLAIAAGVLGGVLFHLAVERPTTHPAFQRRLAPRLQRVLTWTNRLYPAADLHSASVSSDRPRWHPGWRHGEDRVGGRST